MPHPGWSTITPRGQMPVILTTGIANLAPGFRMRALRNAGRLRLWLRRAIRRINDRTVDRIVQMVDYNSLRALYNPISIVELE